ncbi:MAG: cation-efflux pump [Deltaproteobacteria bacterium]|nr:cation-efflux pump [Deltaproteobacteria bacterium]
MSIDPKKRVAFTSVVAAVFLLLFKLYVGIVTNSLGILSEALHSGLDFVAAAITMFAVVTSAKPADRDHPFGHGKIENFSALIETLLLLLTCVWILWEALERIFLRSVEVEATWAAFLVMGVSIAVDISRSRALYRAAKQYNSQALEADALHFSSDILSSLVVIAGLVFVKLGFPLGDPLAAIGVAIWIMIISLKLGKRTYDNLVDRAPEGKTEEIAEKIGEISGVTLERVRVRTAGPNAFVDVKVSMDRHMPLDSSRGVVAEVESRTREVLEQADVMVQVNPSESPDECLASKIGLTALKVKGIKGVHQVEVQKVGADTNVNLHLELDPKLTVKQAHDLVDEFERNAKRELAIHEINTHIETLNSEVAIGDDVTASHQKTVERIKAIIASFQQIKQCHRIAIRRSRSKLSLNMHCALEDEESLGRAHDLCTELEEAIRKEVGELSDINIHVDPYSVGGRSAD